MLTSKNPSDCEPVRLDCVIATPGETGYGNWADSGIISLEEFSGTVYIGFRFESQRGGSSAQVEYNVTGVNYGGADPAEWEVVDPASIGEFRLTTDLQSDHSYAMVYDSKVFQPLIESYSYGYLSASDVAIDNGTFTSSKDNAFRFIAEDGHYVIKDCYDRYLYLAPSYTSLPGESCASRERLSLGYGACSPTGRGKSSTSTATSPLNMHRISATSPP